jgi:hypothetical protein
VELRKNLKEIVVAVSEKDEDERDKMLDRWKREWKKMKNKFKRHLK